MKISAKENIMETVIADMVESGKEAIPIETDDYIVDGLYYCGKCKTPKQMKIEKLGGKIVNVTCQCKKLEEVANKEAERKRKIEDRISAYFGKRTVRTFADDKLPDSLPSRMCRNYTKYFADEMKPNGQGLLIYGNRGTGKTRYADSIAYELMSNGYNAKRLDILQYCSNEEEEAKAEAIKALKEADIVILDGIGKEQSNVKNANAINTLVNMLRDNNTPIIAVTDIPLAILKDEAELKKIKREAYTSAFSTLLLCAHPVQCITDFLTASIKENYYRMKELLEREA